MKFCPKCYDYDPLISAQFCTKCGTRMVDWTLTCECGETIRPSFFELFSPIKSPTYKHCPNCGRRTDKLLKKEASLLRKKYAKV